MRTTDKMWPPKFGDHQTDGHDVEQNETTPWLQQTERPHLFHNGSHRITEATASFLPFRMCLSIFYRAGYTKQP
jgi:hypothetical protein